MLAAAASWDGLADALGSAAQAFSSTTSGLAGQAWQGPASAAMLAAATRYTSFLTAAQAQAETAATQAQAIVGAFESARAATVHPLTVAANRSQLVSLVVSNLFGRNAPAIAAAEAAYEHMWAADVAAMIGYHGGVSAAAAQLSAWPATLEGAFAEASGALANPVGALQVELGRAEQPVMNTINAPTTTLLGRPLIGNGTNGANGTGQPGGPGAGTAVCGGPAGASNGAIGAPGADAPQNVTVPLTMYKVVQPIVYASVNGGPSVPLLLDTGSTGLVLPLHYGTGVFLPHVPRAGGFRQRCRHPLGRVQRPHLLLADELVRIPDLVRPVLRTQRGRRRHGRRAQRDRPRLQQPDHGPAGEPRPGCAHQRGSMGRRPISTSARLRRGCPCWPRSPGRRSAICM